MKLVKVSALLTLLFLISCVTDGFLADQYKPTQRANSSLTNGHCYKLWGKMLGTNSALIFTGLYGLYTEDDFQNFYYNEYNNRFNTDDCKNETMYFDGNQVWNRFNYNFANWYLKLSAAADPGAFVVSSDYLKILSPVLSSKTILAPAIVNVDLLVFASYGDGKINIYSLANNAVQLLSEITTTLEPTQLFFTNNKFILVAINGTKSFIFTSLDAASWNGPFLINDNTDITTIVQGNDVTMAFNNDQLFVSHTEGESWIESSLPLLGKILDIEPINNNLIYAVIGIESDDSFGWISKLATSTDKGITWQSGNTKFYADDISFFDQLHGIAMSKGILQVTHDGGITWRPVLISHGS